MTVSYIQILCFHRDRPAEIFSMKDTHRIIDTTEDISLDGSNENQCVIAIEQYIYSKKLY